MKYFLTGREFLLKKEFIRDLKSKTFQNSSDISLNFQEFSASEPEAFSGFIEFLQTSPFLAEKRMAVLWEVEELEGEDRETLLVFLKKIPSSAVPVLASDETAAVLKKDKFLAALSEELSVVACHAPFDKDLPQWVQGRARKMGLSLDVEAVRKIIERVGKEPAFIQTTLESLQVYIHPRTQIAASDVEALIGKSGQEDAFLLIDEIFKKNSQGALLRLSALLREGIRAPELIGILASQLDRIKKSLELFEQKVPLPEICTIMRVPFFNQDKFLAQLKRASLPEVVRLQKCLLECDLSIKEGRQSDRFAIERFVLEN